MGLAKLICTRESSMTDGMYSGTSSSEDEMPGEVNMWNPLLCTAYHYYNGVRMAQFMTSCSKANISQTCHFAVFLNPVERESMDWFFHIMQEPHERDNEASTACSSEKGSNDGDSSAAEESPYGALEVVRNIRKSCVETGTDVCFCSAMRSTPCEWVKVRLERLVVVTCKIMTSWEALHGQTSSHSHRQQKSAEHVSYKPCPRMRA